MQEEGWPLGLRLLNSRIGLVMNDDFSGSASFSTVLTGSPTPSTDSSSELGTEVSKFSLNNSRSFDFFYINHKCKIISMSVSAYFISESILVPRSYSQKLLLKIYFDFRIN